MPIRYVHGDLFEGAEPMLVHGVNAQGVARSGFALALRKRHPAVFDAYSAAHAEAGLRLGEVVWAQADGRLVGHAVTQEYYGREPGRVYCDYGAIRDAMRRVDGRAAQEGVAAVAMPQIGAGLAQGDWHVIAGIVADEARRFEAVVYIPDRTLFLAAMGMR